MSSSNDNCCTVLFFINKKYSTSTIVPLIRNVTVELTDYVLFITRYAKRKTKGIIIAYGTIHRIVFLIFIIRGEVVGRKERR